MSSMVFECPAAGELFFYDDGTGYRCQARFVEVFGERWWRCVPLLADGTEAEPLLVDPQTLTPVSAEVLSEGLRLRKVRVDAGMSVKAVAEAVGASVLAVYRWESGLGAVSESALWWAEQVQGRCEGGSSAF